jgi:hypothetical protein
MAANDDSHRMSRRHRSPIHRAFAAIMAAWFAFVTGEPVALHRCPMHDGTLVAATPATASHALGLVPRPWYRVPGT